MLYPFQFCSVQSQKAVIDVFKSYQAGNFLSNSNFKWWKNTNTQFSVQELTSFRSCTFKLFISAWVADEWQWCFPLTWYSATGEECFGNHLSNTSPRESKVYNAISSCLLKPLTVCALQLVYNNWVSGLMLKNPFRPEFTIWIFIHYKISFHGYKMMLWWPLPAKFFLFYTHVKLCLAIHNFQVGRNYTFYLSYLRPNIYNNYCYWSIYITENW